MRRRMRPQPDNKIVPVPGRIQFLHSAKDVAVPSMDECSDRLTTVLPDTSDNANCTSTHAVRRMFTIVRSNRVHVGLRMVQLYLKHYSR